MLGYIPRWFTCPQTVSHLSSNQLIANRQGVEPTISRSQVQRPNRYKCCILLSSGVMAIQLSTLGQPRVFPPLSSVLSLVCCLCEWESHHLAIIRDITSPVLHRSSSVSVSMNTTIQGSVWPLERLHSDNMAKVSKTAALDPVHNVTLNVELILNVCISDVRDSWHTKDFPETTHLECS